MKTEGVLILGGLKIYLNHRQHMHTFANPRQAAESNILNRTFTAITRVRIPLAAVRSPSSSEVMVFGGKSFPA